MSIDHAFTALSLGYRVNCYGRVVSPRGKIRKEGKSKKGYLRFNISKGISVFTHQLIAAQQFGDAVRPSSVVVRHLNGNRQDNRPSNIAIGSYSDNEMDRPRSVRLQKARHAARARRLLSDKEADRLRHERHKGRTYKELMDMFGIKSKSTISYIINGRTYNNATT